MQVRNEKHRYNQSLLTRTVAGSCAHIGETSAGYSYGRLSNNPHGHTENKNGQKKKNQESFSHGAELQFAVFRKEDRKWNHDNVKTTLINLLVFIGVCILGEKKN